MVHQKQTRFPLFSCALAIFLYLGLYPQHVFAKTPDISQEKRQALYSSLDPTSITQHLAFYDLYKDTDEGRKALACAWKLLTGKDQQGTLTMQDFSFPQEFQSFIELINPSDSSKKEGFSISDQVLDSIDIIAKHLGNRALKGHTITQESEILGLTPQEIDVGRALFIAQFGSSPEGLKKMRTYEAALDLMALQVLARLPQNATPIDIIRELNQLIFYEMGFRFPPHSIYSKQIDRFTFLPYVIESRRGICLGVSTMYLCLAQRLSLPLEIVTPPGHIYVRYRNENTEINVETTLRGVNIHSDEYLDITMKSLETRNMKEVIGMAFYNQAALCVNKGLFKEAKENYERALIYMPDDTQAKQLLACCLLIEGETSRAHALLQYVVQHPDPHALTQDPLAEDVLRGHAAGEDIQHLFMYVDETHASIVKKKDALEKVCEKHPRFRSALFQLAICWLQLGRPAKGIDILEKIHAIDPEDISTEYYLCILHLQRYNAPLAWKHFMCAQKIAEKAGYIPLSLQQLQTELQIRIPKSE